MLTALQYARRNGVKTALDIDYRPVLWGLTSLGDGETRFVEAQAVTEQLQQVLSLFDVIVGTEEEFHIAGGSTDTLQALRTVRQHTQAELVCKRGALGCSVFSDAIPDHLDKGITIKGVRVDVLNVLGRAMRLCPACCAVISTAKAGRKLVRTPMPAARWWYHATAVRQPCQARSNWITIWPVRRASHVPIWTKSLTICIVLRHGVNSGMSCV